MTRPLKYLPGEPFKDVAELAAHIGCGGYVIQRLTKQRIHPGWVSSWQFRMCCNAIEKGWLLRAMPNSEHPDNKDTAP